MRKLSNVLVGLAAAGVCAVMTWLTLASGKVTVIYNLVVLGVMVLIILLSLILGFRRMNKTVRGLNNASRKLISVYKNRAEMGEITRAGAEIFGVAYLDHKYQEYLGYLRKTNSPCDIGDYIGEYEINNYTHRRMVEMVPDVLTSLGILGTFMGLVWGLRGFNPVSYEAMASSITSLIDGIKVAFVTSIYGIALSLAYSYWLRGTLSNVAESLDNFLDKYYLCAVSPTDATAMNHVLANQKAQTKALENMGQNISDQLAVSMADHMDPVMTQMNRTLEHFTDVVTLNQEQLLEKIAETVMASIKKELFAEFTEMRTLLKETNRAQKTFVDTMTQAQTQFEANMKSGAKELRGAVRDAGTQRVESAEELKLQQQHLTEFVDYMTQAMAALTRTGEEQAALIEAMESLAARSAESAASATRSMAEARSAANEAEHPSVKMEFTDLDELTYRLDQMINLLERQNRQQKGTKKGLFR